MGMLGWPHLLLIVAVVILLFGATKLPLLARSLGQSARAFKGEMRAMRDEDAAPADGPAGAVADPSASAGVNG